MKANLVKEVPKPWGYEKWIAVNDHYALKEIFFKAGNASSLQYHQIKEEDIYVLKGRLKVEEELDDGRMVETIYEPQDILHSSPKRKHRLTALEDSLIMEVSTPFLDDVVRIEDRYGRK